MKEAIRASPELKRETRRANRGFRKHYSSTWLSRGLIALVAGACSAGIASHRGYVSAGVAFLNLWTVAWIFIRVPFLMMALYQSSDLQVFSILPIEKPILFRWELQKFLKASAMSLLDLIVGFAGIALFVNSSTALIAAIPAAFLGWGVMLAIVMLCAARWPRLPYVQISLFIVLVVVIFLFGQSVFGPWLMNALQRFALPLNVLLPTGWAPSLFLFFTGNQDWTLLLLLVPIGALLGTIPSSLARLRARYQFAEVVHGEAPDLLPTEVDEESVAESGPGEQPLRVDSDAITPIVRTHLFSAASWHERGWMEKILWRWLTPRERILSEFAFPWGISLLEGWKKIFRNAGITILTAVVLRPLLPSAEFWVLGVGLGIGGLQALGRLLATGTAFRSARSSGFVVPFYASYGIGYRELSRFFLKYTAVQIPFLILFSLLCGVCFAYLGGLPIGFGLLMGFKAAGLVVAVRCGFLTFAFSSGTRGDRRLRLRDLVIAACLLPWLGLFLFLAIRGLVEPNTILSWILWLLALVDAYVLMVVYGWFYNGRWFDLMSSPRR